MSRESDVATAQVSIRGTNTTRVGFLPQYVNLNAPVAMALLLRPMRLRLRLP